MPTRVGGRPRQKPRTPSLSKMERATWKGLVKVELLCSCVFTTSRGQVTVEETVPAKPPERIDTAEGDRPMRGFAGAAGAERAEEDRAKRRRRMETEGDWPQGVGG